MNRYILGLFALLLVVGCGHTEKSEPVVKAKPPFYNPLPKEQQTYFKARLEKMYDSLLVKRGFNGGILVAKNGEVLLEEYRGYVNLQQKDTITPSTPFHIASISKTFTGMAIMKLWEEKKILLEDTLQKYFPAFPYQGITVRMLLNHRSGLPNYAYFMPEEKIWKKRLATNEDMLQFMIERKPQRNNLPNRGFQYCNTNYALLALIIEKVTGKEFPDYMKQTIFEPLGMNNTFVFSIKDSATYVPSYQYNNVPFPLESMDCIYGDKNVYSTPRDLLQWDDALYRNTFVSKETFEEATKPTSFEKPGTHNYGMGWRLLLLPESKVVYHNGWWHGNNATFTRLVQDTATIIIVGNKFNRAIYAGPKFASVFNKKADDESQVE